MSEEIIYSASWLINPNAPPVAGGALLVRNGIIVATGPLSMLRRSHSVPVFDFPGCALLPGFINAHTHLELTHFPSWKLRSPVNYSPRRFTDWIIQLIKISRGLTAAEYPPSICEGVRMCLESGTTAIGDVVTNPAMAENYRHSPLAGRLYFELLGQDPGFFKSKLAAALSAAQHSGTNSIFNGLSPHSPYTIGQEYLPVIRDVSVSNALPLSIHLSESRSEAHFLFNETGDLASEFYPFVGWERFLGHPARCSSTELLDRCGLLTPTTLAVHCVHVSVADAHIIKSRGVHVALCPRSNELLDVGRAPVALFKKFDIPLALGTDSLASNNSLSLWDELHFALEIFPDDLTEQDVLCMVTTGAAAALGISAVCGSLEPGKRADFQLIGQYGGDDGNVLQRVMREGILQEVFVAGKQYAPQRRQQPD
ncbi:MAG: amidohydrolase family protein [Desulfuromonadaceae bacterium]|nr:amidohydrolase family protein [Desulfuromonadaceae bacterium]